MEKRIGPLASRKMHQTTVRFGEDLWEALEIEAKRLSVSVAQYVRDAALGRLSYDAGRRDEVQEAAAPSATADSLAALEDAQSEVSQSEALWAQGRLARRRAVDLRQQAEVTKGRLVHPKT